jgi:hypothetical protein
VAAPAAKKSIVLSGGCGSPRPAADARGDRTREGRQDAARAAEEAEERPEAGGGAGTAGSYLEHLAGGEGPVPVGKYDATRVIADGPATSGIGPHLAFSRYRERGPEIRATPVPLLSAA